MKFKVQKLLEIKQALKEFENKPLPSRLSYWLGRIEDKINPSVSRFEKLRNDLIIKKYGTKKEGTYLFTVPKENADDFIKEIKELEAEEEDIEIKPLRLELFDGLEVSKDFFRIMGDIIEIE